MIVKCLVACDTGDGPDVAFVMVDCTKDQYENGEHYDAAKDWALDQDCDAPMVVIDENDRPKPLFSHFRWDTATTITTPYGE